MVTTTTLRGVWVLDPGYCYLNNHFNCGFLSLMLKPVFSLVGQRYRSATSRRWVDSALLFPQAASSPKMNLLLRLVGRGLIRDLAFGRLFI